MMRNTAALLACLLTAACGGDWNSERGAWQDSNGSRLTLPRLTGHATTPPPLEEESAPLWPARQPPRMPLTDPELAAPPPGTPNPATRRREELFEPSPFPTR